MLKNETNNMYYLVIPGTNIRYISQNTPVTVDRFHIDSFVENVNKGNNTKYAKIPVTAYHRKYSVPNLIGTSLDISKYLFLVRDGTSERHVNFSGDINLCTMEHAKRILPTLNRYGPKWKTMSIEEYYTTFGMVV